MVTTERRGPGLVAGTHVGDVVLDADGAAGVARGRVEDVLESSLEREQPDKRDQVRRGALSGDFERLRERVAGHA